MGDPGRIACLPMYDWPEVRAHTDALWSTIAAALARCGVDAPPALDHGLDRGAAWRSPRLLLSQTCGLPFVQGLHRHLCVLGAPAYDLDGCAPGDYCSVLVCRADEAASGLADFRGRRVAFNVPDSESGHAALLWAVAPLADQGRFFASALQTGHHRGSLQAVADGRADLAAIDAVCWRLALDHEPAARRLRVLAYTPPAPGLPFVTSRAHQDLRDALNAAAAEAIGALPAATRRALHLTGYRPREARDYAVLEERLAAAARAACTALA